ncbi:unnamed protein product [Spirodela intermedia]|uniref:Uncharacterized protein n=1 Tax=Spirodela intermedia TaxID=51605 RepID=A0ABN7EDK8_SPIIN|nr:unnamed protein product [Spirodela intermedia]
MPRRAVLNGDNTAGGARWRAVPCGVVSPFGERAGDARWHGGELRRREDARGSVWRKWSLDGLCDDGRRKPDCTQAMRARTAQKSAGRLWSRGGLCDDGRRWPERGRSLDSQARMLAECLGDDGSGVACVTTVAGGLSGDARWTARRGCSRTAGTALAPVIVQEASVREDVLTASPLDNTGRPSTSAMASGSPSCDSGRRWHAGHWSSANEHQTREVACVAHNIGAVR